MQTSESDAKFKFCPLLKTADDKMKMCQGTMCMMWRWVDESREEGYCGLAGTPSRADRRALSVFPARDVRE